jgi:hypothetical protein
MRPTILMFECMDCGKQMWLVQNDAPKICNECLTFGSVVYAHNPAETFKLVSEEE